jgi:orotate phosphoribosyltransferase
MTDWKKELETLGVLWLHSGRPTAPHALLTSGLHSDGFFNGTKIMQQPALVSRILRADDGLAGCLPPQGAADWVIGSALGAVTFAYAIAEHLGAKAAFTEKDGERMALKRFELKPGERVLVVEDVVTTGGSTLKTIAGIREAAGGGTQILPFIPCLANRSGKTRLEQWDLRALLNLEIQSWPAENCPLCRGGSTVLRPKAHWAELTGRNGA